MNENNIPAEKRFSLATMQLPEDLKKLNIEQCQQLCKEIRSVLIQTVSKNGGHLASNLGVVELTVAMHRVFDSPQDKFVWDVGHQCYTHKILTGRYAQFSTLRKENGILVFQSRKNRHMIRLSADTAVLPFPLLVGLQKPCGKMATLIM